MANDKIYKRRRSAAEYARTSRNKDTRKRILIVCEGEKTEPNYFESFPQRGDLVKVYVHGEGKNCLSLVEKADTLIKEYKAKNEPIDETWCVFDRDSFSADKFNGAIEKCRTKKYHAVYSNEAFEIWYLLHFEKHDTAYSRKRYEEMLSRRLGEPYKKNSKEMYTKLIDKQNTAIKNAKSLREFYGEKHNPCLDNPCTLVYQLVEALNKNFIG
ncbi:RloB family protein [Seleniivibrio sp.]|uniref:RloB family protein n=1 Tax=Seleniivibrio sp. TaxID=2898801 RepID=UPI0025D33320|nr:RloB family protein [Seleniivibrio sp.]MCD8552379.1 RloB family protein [Seleniivibrio sp.]